MLIRLPSVKFPSFMGTAFDLLGRQSVLSAVELVLLGLVVEHVGSAAPLLLEGARGARVSGSHFSGSF